MSLTGPSSACQNCAHQESFSLPYPQGLSTLIRPYLKLIFPQLDSHVHSLVALLHPLSLHHFKGCSIQTSTLFSWWV